MAKGHLGLVHAREPYCHPTTPELRVSLRRRYYQDEYDVDLTLEALALKERLPEARVARILVGLEGWEGEEFIIPGGPLAIGRDLHQHLPLAFLSQFPSAAAFHC